ncbi:hypothetical protein [Allosaccharopolyspora coralli]|uniref:hypothetical protein n=1 Tax=Allosaccharopolyspora coralli TaxID=2665642 RepID=UPI00165204A2|nr:hypothetical protein [Allosaccharopolyspora coralli]
MKRTLTAAATVLVGSAGVVGMTGTANAVATPEPPANLPVDNNVAQTAYHAASGLHSATDVVGDVVEMGDPVQTQPAGPSPARGGETVPSDASGAEQLLIQNLPTEPLSAQPGAKSGGVTDTLGGVTDGGAPLQDGLAGDAEFGGVPTDGVGQNPLPQVPVVDEVAGQVAAPVAGAAGGSKAGNPADLLSGVVGDVAQLEPGQLPTDQLTGGGLPTDQLPIG